MSAIFLVLDDAHDVERAAQKLVSEAERLGLVLTVDQESLQPFAMGNHRTVITVRAARVVDRPKA